MSNASAQLFVPAQLYGPKGQFAGFEHAAPTLSGASLGRGFTVPGTTLDAFFAERRIRRVALLAIDVNGWDPLVLEGARRTLLACRVDVLSFEYHYMGFWGRRAADGRSLGSTLGTLAAQGYTCFWDGNDGRLAQASGSCWQDAFEFRKWSNLVCTCRPKLRRAFRELSA